MVNNNAAALVLAATALAAGREIIVSRGELIEIGDGFRLPDLIESTGARIREVGTTNRTTAADYAAAIGPQTAFVLKVHPSNYRIEGFTASASIAELAGLRRAGGRRHRFWPADARTRCCPMSPTPAAGSGGRRARDCQRGQAARRPAGRPAAWPVGPDRRTGPASAGEGAARRQADGRGAGGDTGRAAAAGRRAARRRQAQLAERAEPDRRALAAASVDARAQRRDAAVGGGGAPGVRTCRVRRSACPATGRAAAGRRGRAPRRDAGRRRPDRGRAAAAGPARGEPGGRRPAA